MSIKNKYCLYLDKNTNLSFTYTIYNIYIENIFASEIQNKKQNFYKFLINEMKRQLDFIGSFYIKKKRSLEILISILKFSMEAL